MSWALREKDYSQRQACRLVGVAPKVYRHGHGEEMTVRLARLKVLAAERRRFGFRRLHLMLKREGVGVNPKKLFRIFREEKLAIRTRGGRKRALGTRAPMTISQGPN